MKIYIVLSLVLLIIGATGLLYVLNTPSDTVLLSNNVVETNNNDSIETNSAPTTVTIGEWSACVSAGICEEIPLRQGETVDSIASQFTHQDGKSYVAWLSSTGEEKRMLQKTDLDNPNLSRLAENHVEEMISLIGEDSPGLRAMLYSEEPLRTWLDECRPAEDMVEMTQSRREIFGMSPEGPERMNPSGQTCIGDECVECLVAEISPNNITTRWFFANSGYIGLGLMLVQQ